ncbi:MAG: ABC transporter permease [Clostridia bacterium]|nr:ABC transporter permease [Clostridia bacterium]
MKRYRFLFEELVKRDFKKKYKRTILGMLWSVLAPLLNVLVLMLVFVNFFGRNQDHFIIYIFCGTMVMSFYTETTQGCMRALMANASIFTKINVPKYLFLLSKAFQAFINFLLTLVVFFAFCVGDGITFGWHMFAMLYPMLWLLILSFGVGMILSAMYVFFRDVEYLYSIFLTLLNYVSAIFYPTTMLPEQWRFLFYCNPVFVYIDYFRTVFIYSEIPSLLIHVLCAAYALVFLGIGCLIYKKCNHEFLYYV